MATSRAARIEPLEERRLLAIVWTNEFSNNFSTIYGTNSAIATQLVNRAIDNWEAVITDFNYDGDNNPLTNNIYNLTVTAADLGGGGRGSAGTTFSNGLPTQATITIDNNGGHGWFFDQTPLDDAEFTAVANSNSATGSAFQATFVDIVNPLVDFYRTIVHEIGHAMGLASTSPVFSVANPMMTLVGSDPFGGSLYSFHDPSGPYGVTATITTNGGRHLYEVNHPNELMNPGRITPIGSPPETTRQFISDFIVQLLVDAYGYTHVLPSQLDTAHATLDSKTGTLLVQGRAGSLNDTITITTEGASNETIKVVVNGTTERVATAHVTQIVIARNGGSDTISVAPSLASLRKDVDFVVSTNQDSANAGTLGDGLVDLDATAPGAQVSLRAAIRDTNGGAVARSAYIPRGNYKLTIEGTGGDTDGDLDITRNITIVGTGAGETIIDGSGLVTVTDRIFDINGVNLDLSRVTLTGGKARNTSGENGGAIRATNGAQLFLKDSALVNNQTTHSLANGGAIFFRPAAGGTITNSVITANSSANYTGGIYLGADGAAAPVTLTGTIVANNTAVQATGQDVMGAPWLMGYARPFTSGGNNRLTTGGPGFTPLASDYIGPTNYVVTGLADTYDGSTDKVVMSIRDAIFQSNLTAGAQEIWIPGWKFMLTRQRNFATQLTDTDVSYGDLDIAGTTTIRGVNGSTSVAWKAGSAVDAVFDLLGDFTGDGISTPDDGDVDGSDFMTWQVTLGSTTDLRADADDDGIVDGDDLNIWSTYFGSTLTLLGV